jgi:thymidylate synthase (FAD)
MEAHLYTPKTVLDHGFVRVIDYMGDDAAIVQAARVSYGAGTKKARDDGADPLPDAALAFDALRDVRDQAAREAAGLRGAAVDPAPHGERERILRALLDPGPGVLHPRAGCAGRAVHGQQPGRGAVLQGAEAARVLEMLKADAGAPMTITRRCCRQDGQQGLARELARMNLPANIYTQWYWKTDLHNLFHFLRLRADAHAQYEIRVYAEAICGDGARLGAAAYGAFEDYRMGGVQLSAKGVEVLRRRLAGEVGDAGDVGHEQGGMAGVWLRKDVFHGFSEPNGWRGALDCAERLSVGYRYWLDAQFFREDNAELYYESVGNDHWHSATADIVQNINRRCAHVLTLVSPSIYTGDALRQELLRERWVPTTRA